MKSGIFFRTFVMVLIIPSFMAILFAVISIPRERDALMQSLAAQSRGMISTAAEINANAFVANDYGAVVDIGVQLITINPAVRYLLIARSGGSCFVHTPQSWEERPAGDPACSRALETASGIVENNPVTGERVFAFSYPLQYSGIDWGTAQLGMSAEAFDDGMKSVYFNIVAIMAASFVIACMLALLFARQLTNPLLDLRNVTSRIMRGDLSARAQITRSDEIGMLARSLNAMTEAMALSQQSMKDSQAHLESILTSMSEGLIVVNEAATIVMANRAVMSLVGLSEDQLIGSSMYSLFDKPETSPDQHLSEMRKVSHFQDERSIRHTSGILVPVLYSIARIPGAQLFVCVLRDIRERKRAELELKQLNDDLEKRVLERTQALAASEEKYRQLIENASEAIFVLREGILVYANQAMLNLFGGKSQDLIGRKFLDLVSAAEVDRVARSLDEVESNHRSLRLTDFSINILQDRVSWVDMSIVAITWEGIPSLLNFMTDTTRQRDLQSQLLQAQKMEAIGTLAGGLAHDFNNLLMGIMGHANILQHDLKRKNKEEEEDSVQARVVRIQENVQSASRLTQQLLGLARGGKYEIETIDINSLIRNTLEVFGRTKREITIREIFSPEQPLVDGDRGQIEQVLLNLFVNAWHAMPQGGRLTVSTHARTLLPDECQDKGIDPGRYVVVDVEDTGTGMDELTKQRIFEPFFSTKERGKGSGLGLASAYGIIKNHDGAIAVQTALGKGTTMSLYLPLSNAAAAPVQESDTALAFEPGSGTILIVDDQEIASEVASDYLQRMGYDTFVVSSGAEALRFYSKHNREIDLVILDMIMPGMSGTETFTALRAINRDVKVILSSGYSEDGQAAALLSCGCNGFIQKPFSLRELSLKVKSVLEDKPHHIGATAETVESTAAGMFLSEKAQ